jgi:hypothetical protein
MANHILNLQREVSELRARESATIEALADFRAHLASAKFSGADADGTRKDWIATSDVNSRLPDLVSLLTID